MCGRRDPLLRRRCRHPPRRPSYRAAGDPVAGGIRDPRPGTRPVPLLRGHRAAGHRRRDRPPVSVTCLGGALGAVRRQEPRATAALVRARPRARRPDPGGRAVERHLPRRGRRRGVAPRIGRVRRVHPARGAQPRARARRAVAPRVGVRVRDALLDVRAAVVELSDQSPRRGRVAPGAARGRLRAILAPASRRSSCSGHSSRSSS